MRGCEHRAARRVGVNLEVYGLVQPVCLYDSGLSREGDGLRHDLWSAASLARPRGGGLSGRGGPSGVSGRRLSLLTSNLSLLTFQAELG
jgi:hypothetical protein